MLLVAVSGGIDSMCLAEKVRLEGGPFAIAHCNFGLRGDESDGDEAFVRDWAFRYDIRCHVRRFATREFSEDLGISIEMAARKLRYYWFGQLCRQYGYSGVAVAHNANDNAETLILNLLRGTGLKGLVGMKASGFIPDPAFSDIPLLRPLLGLTREEIVAYAREHDLTWREDHTNAENSYRRNKIRNQVFPVFREINPRFVETLNRDMERLAEELAGAREPSPEDEKKPPLQTDRTQSFANVNIVQETWDGSKEVKQPAGMLILDADKLEPAVLDALTHLGAAAFGRWESGDWIRPLGAPGKKKMQDWFTDHHIPADEKPSVPLLKSIKDPHHVLAVVGFCIDNCVSVSKSTRRIVRISAKIL